MLRVGLFVPKKVSFQGNLKYPAQGKTGVILNFEITIPVYNEINTLEEQISKILSFLKSDLFLEHNFVIVIADNGSTDGTSLLMQKLCKSNAQVKYVKVQRKGVGLALKTAWDLSSADVIGYMDLDLATDLAHLNQVVEIFTSTNCSLLNSSRLLSDSVVQNRKLLRNVTSRILNLILLLIFKKTFTDAMCGFKFLRRKDLSLIRKNGADSDGWFFAAQLLLVSEALNLNVIEMPVRWSDDQNSKVRIARLSIEYMREIMQLRRLLKNSGLRKFLRF